MNFAGFWTRMLAFNTDLILLIGIFYGLSVLIENNGPLFIWCGVAWWGYDFLFTASKWHGTPGKYLSRVQVLDKNDKGLTVIKSLLRTSAKILSFALLMGGFTMIALHPKNQGLHDWLTGTFVKYR